MGHMEQEGTQVIPACSTSHESSSHNINNLTVVKIYP